MNPQASASTATSSNDTSDSSANTGETRLIDNLATTRVLEKDAVTVAMAESPVAAADSTAGAKDAQASREASPEQDPSAVSEAYILPFSDGRELCWREYGDESGVPIVFLHQMCGGHLSGRSLASAARRARVKLICPDRPGVGRSSPWTREQKAAMGAGAHIVKLFMQDVAELVCSLQLLDFGVIGWSMGGAYALGAAKWLNELVEESYSARSRHQPDIDSETVESECPKLTAVGAVSTMVPQCYGTKGMPWYTRACWAIAVCAPWTKRIARPILRRTCRKMQKRHLKLEKPAVLPQDTNLHEGTDASLVAKANYGEQWLQNPDELWFELSNLAGPEPDAWGFRPQDIDFVAMDRYGVRFYHGSKDTLFNVTTAMSLACSVPNSQFLVFTEADHENIYVDFPQIFSDIVGVIIGPDEADS